MNAFKLLTIAFSCLAVASCGNRAAQSTEAQAEAAPAADTLTVDYVLAEADSLVGQTVVISGFCTHICKHSGRKIFLMGSDESKSIRVEGAEIGGFAQECVSSNVTVTGVLREERVDEAYLQQWEAQAAAQRSEEHGDKEAGCDTEKKARGEQANTTAGRIADFRAKIAERKAQCGKEYLSFYFVEAKLYEIQ